MLEFKCFFILIYFIVKYLLLIKINFLIFFRYSREKPKKSDEKREKRQKRDEAQQNFKVSS